MSDFMSEINKETKKYGGGAGNSDYFKFEEGDNRMRILTQPKVIAYHFPQEGRPDVCVGIDEGCPHHKIDPKTGEAKKPTIRLCTYIVDRNDKNKIKFAELPLSVSYAINDLQKNDDYRFDEFPMGYDVTITHDPKNKDPKAKYRLLPSPKFTALTAEEEKAFHDAMEKMSPEQYVEKRKAKQKGDADWDKEDHAASSGGCIEYPKDDINPDDIPF